MVLKYSFPGFILAPWSSVRKENERRSKNLSYVCSVCMTFVFLTVIKIDAPCSVLPYPIACRPLASLGVKEFVLKYESVENIFFFLSCLCNSPWFSRVSGALRAESPCRVSAHWTPLESLWLQRNI